MHTGCVNGEVYSLGEGTRKIWEWMGDAAGGAVVAKERDIDLTVTHRA